ncbi:hypothetical protein MPUL_52960 [Mycolicibacterium pulveris]|uniref:Uncharacterized protein n=1 Tax=Mycolicibacterium pulveris TaxID=36813 RepID=A0A7I7URX9_MYCPV|nr:hypothetical protein MPUL_52960 [Mycolicibacterium pulveris]
MSASVEIGALPYLSPVLGSTNAIVAPLDESTRSPPMKFSTRNVSAIGALPSS